MPWRLGRLPDLYKKKILPLNVVILSNIIIVLEMRLTSQKKGLRRRLDTNKIERVCKGVIVARIYTAGKILPQF